MKSKMPPENRPSVLLTREENDLVFRLIGPRCQSLATAIVQLYTTEGPAHNQWFKRDTGILCLIKDNPKRSYFFRIYCMQRRNMIWEHEVYNQIEYKNPRPFLHTFEAENCMVAFNFANEEEAMTLKNNLIEKIELRKQRQDRRQKSLPQNSRISNEALKVSAVVNNNTNVAVHHHPQVIPTNTNITVTNTHLHNGSLPLNVPQKTTKSASAVRSKSRKLTKADIGLPRDFKHVSHVGWDANKGFDVDLPEKDMKDFFFRAGVSESQLQDKDTRDFIYDFIKSHGGVDAVKEALVEDETGKKTNSILSKMVASQTTPRQMPPPVPQRNLGAPAPPPVPAIVKEVNGSRHAPMPPARAPPPPPPPPQRQLPPPPAVSASIPPPPPPPPAPPMMPSTVVTSPTPVANPTTPAQPDVRAALMESIRSGKSLKHVETDPKPVDNKRGDLLSEIRQGIELRSVTTNANDNVNRNSTNQAGLAGALARALAERSKVMHSDSSDSDEDDIASDGDEWED